MQYPENASLFLISSIPATFSAADLRRIFSQYVEAGAFVCFHYRRRPQSQELDDVVIKRDPISLLRSLRTKRRKCSSCCGLFLLKEEFSDSIQARLEELWTTDEVASATCRLARIQLGDFSILQKFIEFRPPHWMPQGNVGTSSTVFFDQIRSCRLSPDVIRKLHLTFPRSLRNRRYGAVPLEYSSLSDHDSGSVPSPDSSPTPQLARISESQPKQLRISFSDPVPSDDLPEEWDRFEALHDDPYNVDRTANKNLKYENKIELKWEKGGPGVVFYTDEFAWRQADSLRKEEFFDEPASFDWDIDMQHYEDGGGGDSSLFSCRPQPGGVDLDSYQLMEMQGVEADASSAESNRHPHSSRPSHGKEFSQRLMWKYGWRPGSRLGSASNSMKGAQARGLLHPLTAEGALPPNTRTGLGFRNPRRLTRFPISKHDSNSHRVYIRSVFDSDEVVATRSGSRLTSYNSLLRPDPELEVKYRPDWRPPNATDSTDQAPATSRTPIIRTPHSVLGLEGVRFTHGGTLHPSSSLPPKSG
nr:unnamed protein product [Spirometra erinaceieuropaei]